MKSYFAQTRVDKLERRENRYKVVIVHTITMRASCILRLQLRHRDKDVLRGMQVTGNAVCEALVVMSMPAIPPVTCHSASIDRFSLLHSRTSSSSACPLSPGSAQPYLARMLSPRLRPSCSLYHRFAYTRTLLASYVVSLI